MNQRTTGERLSAAVLAIEDELFWDALDALDTATRVEAEAAELGDELLVQRARLCRINAMMRTGDLAGAARGIWGVHRWAVDHDATELRARSHFVWANIHRLLGDAAQCLEHSVLSVELLDDDATPFMHRTNSIDYLHVLEGEIVMLMDEGVPEVVLRKGDTIVQRATNHAWVNRSGAHCRLLVVMVAGRITPALEEKIGPMPAWEGGTGR